MGWIPCRVGLCATWIWLHAARIPPYVTWIGPHTVSILHVDQSLCHSGCLLGCPTCRVPHRSRNLADTKQQFMLLLLPHHQIFGLVGSSADWMTKLHGQDLVYRLGIENLWSQIIVRSLLCYGTYALLAETTQGMGSWTLFNTPA